jgi:hypothetical protein
MNSLLLTDNVIYIRSNKETFFLYIILFLSLITSSIGMGYGRNCVFNDNNNITISNKPDPCFYVISIGWVIILYSFAMFFMCKKTLRKKIPYIINNLIMYSSTFSVFYCTGAKLCKENIIYRPFEPIIIITIIGTVITTTSFFIINCIKPSVSQHSYS